jgi:hypothetical protein
LPPLANKDDRLQVAKFDHQVTGVTVSEDGRVFVNFPVGLKDARQLATSGRLLCSISGAEPNTWIPKPTD